MSATVSLLIVIAVLVCCIAVIRMAIRKPGSTSAGAQANGQKLYKETEHLPGNFMGFSVYRISNPAEAHTITEYFLVKKKNYIWINAALREIQGEAETADEILEAELQHLSVKDRKICEGSSLLGHEAASAEIRVGGSTFRVTVVPFEGKYLRVSAMGTSADDALLTKLDAYVKSAGKDGFIS
ncbi:MAG: hypothetical protein II152_08500 [Succinivibrionaceae bacterium]|nr:hypothetical protein [Succinivibrionaceae bacterium]